MKKSCYCCAPRINGQANALAHIASGGLPAYLLQDLFVWYKFDGLPGETFVTDYSIHGRHGSMVKNTQTLDYGTESINPLTWGLKWGPAPGAGTSGSAVHFSAPDSMPSPNLISVFAVINSYGGGNFNFSNSSNLIRCPELNDVSFRPFGMLLSRGGVGANVSHTSNIRGTSTPTANAISDTGSVPAGGDVAFSTTRWRLINYKRQGSGTSNHHMRINRKVQTLTTAAGDYVAATPPNAASDWRLGKESSGAGGFFVGYFSWLMIFVRNLTSAEELLVEDFIYDEMADRGIFLVDLP